MGTLIRFGRAARWLASTGVFALPACTLPDPEPSAPTLAQARMVSGSLRSAHLKSDRYVQLTSSGAEPASPMLAALPQVPTVADKDKLLPINLATALTLTNVNPIDVIAATERIRVASAQLEQARVLWLPSITLGFDYNRHDGKIQNADGTIDDASRSSMMFGAGSGIGNAAIVNVNDAIFGPLVARQTIRARQADLQAAQNDSLAAVTDVYFTVQQARGELAAAIEIVRKTEDLVQRTKKLAVLFEREMEVTRAEAELARRQQVEELARERWRVAGAELVRILRLDPSTQVDPVESPHLRIDLIDPARTVDDLIPIALTTRPELASRQAQVQATLTLLKQAKLQPLVPSVLLRGWSTPVTGTLAAGVFAGGTNGNLANAGLRGDIDLQLLWQFDNLGFGNRARTHQREAENRLAVVELFRIQDRVAADVAQSHARAQEASRRMEIGEKGVRIAAESLEKNLLALSKTRPVGELNQLVVRPQEVIAAVQTLAQAYVDYYTAVADYNRAQFQLYRALGHPTSCLANSAGPSEVLPASLPTQTPQTCPSPGSPPSVVSLPKLMPTADSAPATPPSNIEPADEWRRSSNPQSSVPVPVSVNPRGSTSRSRDHP